MIQWDVILPLTNGRKMKKVLIIIASFLLLALSSTIAFCEPVTIQAEITNFGVMKLDGVEVEKNNQLFAGEKHVADKWSFIEKTTIIPNRIGVEFGIEYKILNYSQDQLIEVEEVIIFPGEGLTNPDIHKTTKIDIEKLQIDPSAIRFFSYKLEDEWDRKKGEWIFQVRYQDKVLVEKVFSVE